MTLLLTLDEINVIMGILGRQPYEQVESLIKKIRDQALPQLEAKTPIDHVPQFAQVEK
jgi:hypothetical protein